MASVNKVILVGRLGKDPELKYTQSGDAVANFSIATDETWKDQSGEKQQRTEWHNIVAWKKLADICGEYVKKGQQVYIEGKLQTRKWEDQEGNTKYKTEIVANNLVMLGKKEDNGGGSYEGEERASKKRAPSATSVDDGGITDDDIPF
jgi:single-strand DNA-binding protein